MNAFQGKGKPYYFDCKIAVEKFEPVDVDGLPALYDHFDGPSTSGLFVRVGTQEFYPGTGYTKRPVPLSKELTIDRLLKIVRERKIESIEGVLPFLPQVMKRDTYVVMYRSQSLQSAEPHLPRIVSYTPSSRFVLSFNAGSESQYGGDTIEMIQFDDSRFRWDFYELAFRGGRPRVSQANPKKCAGCHQSLSRTEADYRPNWEPYNSWPGAFGSFSLTEGMFRSFKQSREFMSKATPEDQDMIEEQAHEPDFYRAYTFTMAANHPRYKHFPAPKLKAATHLNQNFGELNFLRVARFIVENQTLYEKYKYLLWFGFHCYPPNRDLFAAGLSVNRRILLERKSPYEKEEYGKFPGFGHMPTGRFLTLLFEPFTDTSDWSMDFFTLGRFSLTNDRFGMPGKSEEAFRTAYSYVLGKRKPADLAQLRSLSCEQLREIVLPR
jgi:hypothetical protein